MNSVLTILGLGVLALYLKQSKDAAGYKDALNSLSKQYKDLKGDVNDLGLDLYDSPEYKGKPGTIKDSFDDDVKATLQIVTSYGSDVDFGKFTLSMLNSSKQNSTYEIKRVRADLYIYDTLCDRFFPGKRTAHIPVKAGQRYTMGSEWQREMIFSDGWAMDRIVDQLRVDGHDVPDFKYLNQVDFSQVPMVNGECYANVYVEGQLPGANQPVQFVLKNVPVTLQLCSVNNPYNKVNVMSVVARRNDFYWDRIVDGNALQWDDKDFEFRNL